MRTSFLLLLLLLLLPLCAGCPWAALVAQPSAPALAACTAACKSSTLPALPAGAGAQLQQLLARASEHPETLALASCLVEASLVPPTRALLLEAALRKSGSLLAAVLQRGGAGLFAGQGGWEAPAPGRPAWSPVHALLSNKLHALSLVQDVLRARPAQGPHSLAAHRGALGGLLGALRRHALPADALALNRSAEALGVGLAAPAAPAPGLATVAMGALQPIANAVSLQLLRLLLAAAAEGGAQRATAAALAAAPDALGRTPLHLAAGAGSASAIALLWSTARSAAAAAAAAAAPPPLLTSARDALHRTPLHYACAAQHWAAAAALLELQRREEVGGEAAAPLPVLGEAGEARVKAACSAAWLPLLPAHAAQEGGAEVVGEAEVRAHGEGGLAAAAPLEGAPGGGWSTVPLPAAGSLASAALAQAARCLAALPPSRALRIITNATTLSRQFLTHFFSPGVPFVLRNGGRASGQALAGVSFTRQALLARAGQCNVTHGQIPYAKGFSAPGARASSPAVTALAQFVREVMGSGSASGSSAPEYVFEASHPLMLDGRSAVELLPPWLAAAPLAMPPTGAHSSSSSSSSSSAPLVQGTPKPQFFLGPAGSGAPMHFHKDAVNILAHGRKQWWLLPPRAAMYSVEPSAAWVAGGGGACSECLVGVQEEGDVVYVPAGWGHAVLNLQASVGYALEWGTEWHASV